MKKVLFLVYSLITIFCLSYGIPLLIINYPKGFDKVILYLIASIVGILLLIAGAIVILIKKKKDR